MKNIVTFSIILILNSINFEIYGQKIAYPFEFEKSGSGENSIIFIPGFASFGEVWKETNSSFESDFTCYILTMAGFAGIPPLKNPSMQIWVEGIKDLITNENLNKPVLVGHSLGGVLSMMISARYPNLVSRIVVVDALPCLPALMNPAFQRQPNLDCNEQIEQIVNMSNQHFYQMQQASIRGLIADTSRHKMAIEWSMKSDRKTFAKIYCELSNTDLRESIGNITCPSLILLESNFINFKPAIEHQYKNLETAELDYATQGLHFIMYDDPDWYKKQLNTFIK